MRAVAIDSYGGPEALRLQDVPDPKVGPDSVLVEVAAASINPVDYKIVQGYLDAAFPVVFPLVPGWDVAGRVVAAGPAVRSVRVGQDVVGYARMDFVGAGTWADQVAVPVRGVAPAPASLTPVEASCLPLAGLTAWQSLVEVLQVGQGDTVLVNAASGGVGHLGVQIALAQGARVIGSASERNGDFLRALGAEPVAYGEGFVDAVRELAPHGVDAAVDSPAGPASRSCPDCSARPVASCRSSTPTRCSASAGRTCSCGPMPGTSARWRRWSTRGGCGRRSRARTRSTRWARPSSRPWPACAARSCSPASTRREL